MPLPPTLLQGVLGSQGHPCVSVPVSTPGAPACLQSERPRVKLSHTPTPSKPTREALCERRQRSGKSLPS